jgi:hypothetical protein
MHREWSGYEEQGGGTNDRPTRTHQGITQFMKLMGRLMFWFMFAMSPRM